MYYFTQLNNSECNSGSEYLSITPSSYTYDFIRDMSPKEKRDNCKYNKNYDKPPRNLHGETRNSPCAQYICNQC